MRQMEKYDIKTHKLITVIAAAVVFCFALALVSLWKFGRINALKEEISLQEQERIKVQQALQLMRDFKDSVFLIDEDKISAAIDEITQIAGQRNLKIVSIQTKHIKRDRKKSYSLMPLEIQMSSGYPDLGKFLGSLRTLNEAAVIVSEFEIKREGSSPPLVQSKIVANVLLNNNENK